MSQKTSHNSIQKVSVIEQIDDILSLRIKPEIESSDIKTQISDLLWESGKKSQKKLALEYLQFKDARLYHFLPSYLQWDREIVLTMVGIQADFLKYIPVNLQHDSEVVSAAFLNILWKNKSLGTILPFLERYQENSPLHTHLVWYITWKPEVSFHSTLENQLFDLYISEYKNYKTLKESGVFESISGKLFLGWNLWKYIFAHQEQYNTLKQKERSDYILKLSFKFLKQDENNLSHKSQAFLISLLSTIFFQKIKQKGAKEREVSENSEENGEKIPEDINYDYEVLENYNYSHMWASYRVWESSPDFAVTLSSKQVASMSETSLQHYISFSHQMSVLWLWFLIKKHSSKIMIATDIDFYSWEGMTEARILTFLNKIGRNIWVPEKSFQSKNTNEDTEHITETRSFRSLQEAIFTFRAIKSSGKINGRDIVDPANSWDKSVVECAMIQLWLIIPPYFELAVAKFR